MGNSLTQKSKWDVPKYLFPTVCYNTVEDKSVHTQLVTSNLCNNQTGARFLTKHLKFKLG